MKILLNTKSITLALTWIVIILASMHIAQLMVYFYFNDPSTFDFIELVDFDYEGNLPSLYSSLAIFYCGLLLLLIATHQRRNSAVGMNHWLALSLIFMFLAVDEGVGLHEEIGDLTEEFIQVSGYLYFAWVIPYGIALIFFLISYLKFLINIPRTTAIQFVIAGTLFVTGALGIEVFSALEADANGTKTILYSVLYTIEELCEMFGIIIFANALMHYITNHIGSVNIAFKKT